MVGDWQWQAWFAVYGKNLLKSNVNKTQNMQLISTTVSVVLTLLIEPQELHPAAKPCFRYLQCGITS